MNYTELVESVRIRIVGINSYAVGRSAECPPSRTKRRPAFLFGSTQLIPTCCLLALTGLLVFAPGMAQAKDAPTTPSVSRTQAQAFGLGYALRIADLRAVAYTKSVETLKDVSDSQVAGAEVAHFSSEVPNLRHTEAASYAQAAALLDQMGAPPKLRQWAAQSAATLNAPLVYSKDAEKMAKTEPASAAVLAELVEIQNLKAAADAQQTPMTLWLEITGGKAAPWTADVGAYAAALHSSAQAAAPSRLSSVTAQILLQHAPADAPAATRESLATLIPSGGGNLQNMATLAPPNVTPEKITHVYETLLTLYHAKSQAETLDKNGE
jgi:hypothetical protein